MTGSKLIDMKLDRLLLLASVCPTLWKTKVITHEQIGGAEVTVTTGMLSVLG